MENVEFMKLDLLDVAAINQVFSTVECIGVLHHMEDPAKGLSVLNQQLIPGGYFKLGLYSEIARQDIAKARKQIKDLGFHCNEDYIRMFRQKVLSGDFRELVNLPKWARDFYSLSECRDLCFHVQEHRFTTGMIKELLDSQGLIFCGFLLPESIRNAYRTQFPADTDMISLDNWGYFEQQNPLIFAAMYQFWAYKPLRV